MQIQAEYIVVCVHPAIIVIVLYALQGFQGMKANPLQLSRASVAY